MAHNLDRSLNDIIGSQGAVRQKRSAFTRPVRSSPYARPPGNRARSFGAPERGGTASIYVGNLGYSVSWQDLKDLMRSTGSVKHVEIFTNPDGSSKGCAVVEFESPADAVKAIMTLNDTEFEGRPLHIREDREAGKISNYSAVPVYSPGSAIANKIRLSSSPDCQVYVGNLPFSTSWQGLKDQCSHFGSVVRADVEIGADGRSKGYGLVVFETASDARHCIDKLNGAMLEDRPLVVHLDNKPASAPWVPVAASRPSQESYNVYVGNLPFSASWQDLKDLGKMVGSVLAADIATDASGRSRGFGILTYANLKDAYACIGALNGRVFENRALIVKEDAQNPLRAY